MTFHLLVDISAHGFGHLAQAAEVVNALGRRLPGLHATVRTDLPADLLDDRLRVPYQTRTARLDPGMVMADALTVLPEDSQRAYAAFHEQWLERVQAEAREMAALAPDLVLADVPYLSLAAARQAGLPAAALCSLDWAGVFAAYCGHLPGAEAITAQIEAAYRDARVFLQPRPHMPMDYLNNRVEIGPIAATPDAPQALLRRKLPPAEHVVLVSLGGLPFPLPLAQWPERPGTTWLFPGEVPPRADMVALKDTGLSHIEAVVAVDAVVTKMGYGTLVEAACQGTDILYLPRGDWPEEPAMEAWLAANARTQTVTRPMLERGELGPALDAVTAQPRPSPPIPSGAEDAASLLAGWLEDPDTALPNSR